MSLDDALNKIDDDIKSGGANSDMADKPAETEGEPVNADSGDDDE